MALFDQCAVYMADLTAQCALRLARFHMYDTMLSVITLLCA